MQRKADIRARVLAARDALTEEARAEKSDRVCRELTRLLDARLQGAGEGLVVTAFARMGTEVDVAAFAREAYARGCRVAYPCMERNPAWEKAQDAAPVRADRAHGQDVRAGAGAAGAAGAGAGVIGQFAGQAGGPGDLAVKQAPFVPRLLMRFRLVAREQFESGAVPFIARPLRSFVSGAPELDAFPRVEPEQAGFVVCPLVAFDAEGNRLGYGGGNYDGFLARVLPGTLVAGVGFAEQEVPVGDIPLEPHDLPLPRVVSA